MNTPIIKISDDQNEITHESGVVTVFEWNNDYSCDGCVYRMVLKNCFPIPCRDKARIDKKEGIFKLKHNADTI